ncbi:P-loop containing nucleoside triphosphate hydrolase protein [Guyanagaster necrorhizus]|uniref:P-loop containing nucleoside triphosphate hydrolase protein n=1 Tax=Guyanagaster necrorhizus TaxID=856835 RepID=A0A9P7VP84_9AGAR|nr:P-loop containing nucleoside triphosphate hydrolase protein [Guyanagaster necrorhizus MCA 3950]KAG7444173.1 P-loop containing nucleoside triphosphate hydrolase protein [Guyanagaster necrorhizus MCA 3950]
MPLTRPSSSGTVNDSDENHLKQHEPPKSSFFSFLRRKRATPEKDIIDEKDTAIVPRVFDQEIVPISFVELFRYATIPEKLLNVLGIFAAAASGAAQPLMTLLFGRLVQDFTDFATTLFQIEAGDEDAAARFDSVAASFRAAASANASYLAYIGIGMFACTYVYMMTWVYTAEVIAKRIREYYLEATLRQDIAYFDNVGAGEIATRIQTDTDLAQKGLGEKVPIAVSCVAAFICGFVLAYVRSWKLALAMTSIIPVIAAAGAAMNTRLSRNISKILRLIAEGGSVAEEVISSVRTVHAFGVQGALAQVYNSYLLKSRAIGMNTAMWIGVCIAILLFTVYAAYALAFYFGTTLLISGDLNAGTIVNVIFAILIGSFSLAILSPQLQAIEEACGAAAKLYATIDRVPPIDAYSEEGLRPETVVGQLDLEGIRFNYPSRPTVPVLKGINLHFNAGKTTALVGSSGSGKSTLIALVERFYDPSSGVIKLDGRNVKDLNIKWLRSQIGLVSQEPTLFDATIWENVAHGLINTKYEDLSKEEKMKIIKEACIMSNADSFISKLPDGYETVVGERAILLSGGQKQRIAIARAIVSDPKILLLDEATSALDTQSEGIVQDALYKVAAGRTTITVAHRLSTIKDADTIYVMGDGLVIEEGNHNSLLSNSDSAYYKLVQAQKIREGEEIATTEADVSDSKTVDEKEPDDFVPLDRVKTHQSVASQALEQQMREQQETRKRKYSIYQLFMRMLLLNRESWDRMIIGAVAAIMSGAIYPSYGIVFAYAISGFSQPDDHVKRHDGDRNALWLFIISLIAIMTTMAQNWYFVAAATTLMARLRFAMFTSILRQDIKFFDEAEHSTGSLVSSLSDDPQKVNGLAGMILATLLQSISTLVVGYIIGLSFSWKIGLVGIACTPLVIISGYIRLRVVVVKDKYNKKAHEESAQLACEAAGAIRTVASLTREKDCLHMYSQSLEKPLQLSNKTAVWSNMMYAFAQSVSFWVIALVFWFGSRLVSELEITSTEFFVGLMSTTFAAIQAGNIFQHAPDMSEAKEASEGIVQIFDSMPEIDAQSPEGESVEREETKGHIRFEGVHFRYPTRPGVRVLRDLNLDIKQGTYVALVGQSGCGKSTTIQLIERFYDPLAGRVTLDGKDISNLNVAQYRQLISLVSQEPTLYSGTVRFNVLLGAIKPREEVTEEEIEEACRKANILDFIDSLPQKFETEVGGKGSQLSGGQKQRIAIARALLRDPRVLLLDEATSALDSSSEKVVQAALDQAAKGRTTIAIAHRLSTIQNADCIYFIKDGGVSESGTHDQLIAQKGDYYEFVQMQALSKKD